MIGGSKSHCNYLQNVVAITYKKFLQLPTKRACKKQEYLDIVNET